MLIFLYLYKEMDADFLWLQQQCFSGHKWQTDSSGIFIAPQDATWLQNTEPHGFRSQDKHVKAHKLWRCCGDAQILC